MKNKIILLIGITIAILMYSTTSHAALQANGNSTKTDTINNWLLNIRKMEATGGTLGLTDTINTTNLTSSASESNNLDIHMELNTEYGAMAILSASSYGNPNKITSGETTTGNKSGVYMNINTEWVSGGPSRFNQCGLYGNIDVKYKSVYSSSTSRTGDAMFEMAGWHSGSTDNYANNGCYVRAFSGSVFSYSNKNSTKFGGVNSEHGTRAVIVIGTGL